MKQFKLLPADAQIIDCLRRDARSSAAHIAKQLHMPETTVRHRLNRLVKQGVIEFVALSNPLELGYHIWALIEVQVDASKIRSIARRLANEPEVYFVGITTGSYDIFAAAVFRSNEELLDFLTGRFGKIRGIVRTSTSSVLEVAKRAMTFLPAEVLPDGNRHWAAAARRTSRHKRSRSGEGTDSVRVVS